MTQRGIESVIDELVMVTRATIAVPEREQPGRRPSAVDLARPDDDPRVMVDASLWSDIERQVELRAGAVGTIPPPVGAYCEIEPVRARGNETTDKLPCVSREASGEIEILDLEDPDITLDEVM